MGSFGTQTAPIVDYRELDPHTRDILTASSNPDCGVSVLRVDSHTSGIVISPRLELLCRPTALLLDSALKVVAASRSFCSNFQIDPAKTEGYLLSELGAGEWNKPQLISMLEATAFGHATIEGYETEFKREGKPARCLVLNAQKLSYSDEDDVRLVLTVPP